MFGGKGGLGKTTFSAAAGYHLAKQGHRVLVFSVDPQASLSDIFEQDLFGKGPVQIMDNLWAQEIDADRRIKAYQDEIRGKIKDMYSFKELPEEIESYIQAASAEPAMEESAIFDAVVDIMVAGEYDYYIYDLVPLGHALYYLSMATVYDAWIDKITSLREQMREYDQVAAHLKRGDSTLDEDAILDELHLHQGPHPDQLPHPHGPGAHRLFLRAGARGDDHPGHGQGRGALQPLQGAHLRLHSEPGASHGTVD